MNKLGRTGLLTIRFHKEELPRPFRLLNNSRSRVPSSKRRIEGGVRQVYPGRVFIKYSSKQHGLFFPSGGRFQAENGPIVINKIHPTSVVLTERAERPFDFEEWRAQPRAVLILY